MSNGRKRSAISLVDLPSNVLVEILARLPLRTLFLTRSVCKTFISITTHNPHFINLHSSNAPQILAFQFVRLNIPSPLLHFADQELDSKNSQLKPLFQLPKMGADYKNSILRVPVLPFANSCFEDLNTLFLVNSCNGLLFLHQNGYAGDYGSLVCNPVTSEYMVIPDPKTRLLVSSRKTGLWLGFSPGTEQYKVLRIFHWKNADTDKVAAQVYVIGSDDSWRDIDDTPQCDPRFNWDNCFSQLVNELVYLYDFLCVYSMISFDFDKEKFEKVALPPKLRGSPYKTNHNTSIGVLGGCLCMSYNNKYAHRVDLWVMRKCGSRDSWTKEFVVDTSVGLGGERVCGPFMPLQFLGNGEIFMLWNGNALVCYDPRTKTLRYFKLHGEKYNPTVVALTPSFVPLKDTLKVDKVLTQLRPRGDENEL